MLAESRAEVWEQQRTPGICYVFELEVLLQAGMDVLGSPSHQNWCLLNKSDFDHRVSIKYDLRYTSIIGLKGGQMGYNTGMIVHICLLRPLD